MRSLYNIEFVLREVEKCRIIKKKDYWTHPAELVRVECAGR